MSSYQPALVFRRHVEGRLYATDDEKLELARRLNQLKDRRYAPASIVRQAAGDLAAAALELQRRCGSAYTTCQRQALNHSEMAPWYQLYCRQTLPDNDELFRCIVRIEISP